jgi:hypothetical protein
MTLLTRLLRIVDMYGTPHEACKCIYRDIIRHIQRRECYKISLLSWIILRESCAIALKHRNSIEFITIEPVESYVSDHTRARNTIAALYALIGLIHTHLEDERQ